jgi:spore coat polysaccharide biosynthesis predicted glycosyltransferase SpsG
MSVVVFANAGPDVGLGHLVRCLALVRQLREQDVTVDLWTPPSGTSNEFFDKYDIAPSLCPHSDLTSQVQQEDPQVVVIDSYELTSTDVEIVNDLTTTVVIDELGDRYLPVDMVVNNNIYADQIGYPDADIVLRGPSYSMLRSEFRDLTNLTFESGFEGLHLLLTIGGTDLRDSFGLILKTTTEAVPEGTTVHAIVGPYFDDDIKTERVRYHRIPSNLPSLMSCCDFAVTGGGQTLYELAACGTPAVAVRLGDDQIRNIVRFEQEGFCIDAGWPNDAMFKTRLRDGISKMAQPEHRTSAAQIGQNLVDGEGAIRVADQIRKISIQ